MFTWVVISTLLLGVGSVLAWFIHQRSQLEIVVDPRSGRCDSISESTLPLISVIIPARNEQRNIQRCLEALFRQAYPRLEFIVVDDHSEDETPNILARLSQEDARLHVLHGSELPSGWAGKPHALVQGAAEARGEWLCFMDADTFAEPELLCSTYYTATQKGADMFSILTDQDLGSFWERAILPLVFLGLAFGFPAQKVNDPTKPDAISNGQYILIRRNVYDRVGGHASVKARIDEDKAIAAVVKRAGFRLILADGRRVARTRMYTSLSEMWEGWTKNIYLGLQDKLWLLLFGAFLGLIVSLLFPVWLFGSLAWLISGGGLPALIVVIEAAFLWSFLVRERMRACREFRIPLWYAFTFPLGAAVFTLMMAASAFNVISGRGVLWKGRRYR